MYWISSIIYQLYDIKYHISSIMYKVAEFKYWIPSIRYETYDIVCDTLAESLFLTLGFAVVGLNSCHQNLFVYGRPRWSPVRPDTQSSKKLLEDIPFVGLLVIWTYTCHVSVSNLHGMTTNNQPTKIICKCLINFCFQLCVVTAIITTLIFLVILAINSIWKIIVRVLVRSVNPIFKVIKEISKLRKLVGI